MQKEQAETKTREDAIKLALLSHEPRHGAILFPEMFRSQPASTDKEIDDALSGDGPVVIQSMPTEEIEAVLARIGNGGMISSEDISSMLTGGDL